MRIAIVTVQVPFVRGGAEMQAEGLRRALVAAGHAAEITAIPFKWSPPERILDHMLACRLLDLTESMGRSIDCLIGLKFPAYLVPHPNKVLWILHQHRQAYELWAHPLGDMAQFPNGVQVRDAIQQADRLLIPQARAIFAESATVARRLKEHCGIDSIPLYHPPQDAEQFYAADAEDYVFFPSRLSRDKRQALVLAALAETRLPVRVRFAGSTDEPAHAEELQALARALGVQDRVEWLGYVSERDKRQQYAQALGVVFPPADEDYGYVTLEAMLAAKPVITCADSGGPLEFVRHGETGLIAEPTAAALAAAMDTLWRDRAQARAWGEAGRAYYTGFDMSWPKVVRCLLS